jgi:hypothetical protein
MAIITKGGLPEQSFVVRVQTLLGRNHVQKQSNLHSVTYLVPDSRTEERDIELPAGGTYESNMSEVTQNLVIITTEPVTLNVTLANGTSNTLTVRRCFVIDSTVKHYTIVNSSSNKALISLNTVTSSFDLPLGLVYIGIQPRPTQYNEAFVKSLPAFGGTKEREFQVNAGSLDKIFYCYPMTYGAAQFLVNGFVGGFGLVAQVSVSTSNGEVVYNVYESDNAGLGATTVKVLG